MLMTLRNSSGSINSSARVGNRKIVCTEYSLQRRKELGLDYRGIVDGE